MSCSSQRGVWTSTCSAGLPQPNQSEHPLFARECHLLSKMHVLRRKWHGWSDRWIYRIWFRRNSCPLIATTEGKALVESAWIHWSRGTSQERGQYSITVSFWLLWWKNEHFGSESQTFLFGNTDTLPDILVRAVVIYLSAVPYQGLPLDYSSLLTEEEHNLWSYWMMRIAGNLWGVWVTKNEGIKWLYGYPRNDLCVFFKAKYFGVWAKGYHFQKIKK